MRVSLHSEVVFEDAPPLAVRRNPDAKMDDDPTAWHIGLGFHGWLFMDENGFQMLREKMNEAHEARAKALAGANGNGNGNGNGSKPAAPERATSCVVCQTALNPLRAYVDTCGEACFQAKLKREVAAFMEQYRREQVIR